MIKGISDNFIVWLITTLIAIGIFVGTFRTQGIVLADVVQQQKELTVRVEKAERTEILISQIRCDIQEIKSDLKEIKKIVYKPIQ